MVRNLASSISGRPGADKKLSHTDLQSRLLLILCLFLGIGVVYIMRLVLIGSFDSPVRPAYAASDHLDPGRGDLVDRNGVPLARNISAYAVWVVPDKLISDKKQLAARLVQIFPDMDRDEVLGKLSGKPTYLRRRALPEEVNRVHALGEVGIEFPREAERFYPQHDLAAHVLGFLNNSGKPVLGMERALDKRLSDASRRRAPVALSIDVRVQSALEEELGRAMKLHSAIGAAGVILDVDSGEVLAMASMPDFNPNKLHHDDVLYEKNRVTFEAYELGSTFKPLTVAAALDAGTVTNIARRYDATKPLEIGGFKINDDHPQRRWLNVPETLVHSSNIVTARIADDLGKEKLQETMLALGFNHPIDIELRERVQPVWPRSWGRITNMTVGYGHGIAVSPLHLANAYAALVNGGIWRPTTLLRRNADQIPEGRRVFKAATSARMRQLLRMIVSDGTGRNADAPGFRIGGKTGSAEKPADGGYRQSKLISTFAAAFPMDAPRYVLVVMLDEPQGIAATSFQRTAGWTVAPVVARLVPRIGPMLGVIPDDNRDVDVSDLTPLLWHAPSDRKPAQSAKNTDQHGPSAAD